VPPQILLGPRIPETLSTIIVTGLAEHHDFHALHTFFAPFGRVTSIRIREDHREAEIDYAERDSAQRASAATLKAKSSLIATEKGRADKQSEVAQVPTTVQLRPPAAGKTKVEKAPKEKGSKRSKANSFGSTHLAEQLQAAIKRFLLASTPEAKLRAKDEMAAIKSMQQKLDQSQQPESVDVD